MSVTCLRERVGVSVAHRSYMIQNKNKKDAIYNKTMDWYSVV